MIRKTLLLVTLLLTAVGGVSAQKSMTPPTVMIVPDMIYCKANGFTREFNNMGVTEIIPDYERALSEDASLHSALTQIAQLINDRNKGFVIMDLDQAINLAKQDAAMSAANGGDTSESVEEAIIRNSNADIIIKLQFDLLKTGPSYRVSYTLRGTDAYTGNNFAPLEGTGPNATNSNPVVLLREAIYGSMDGFLDKLLAYYQGMITRGRMVSFDIKTTAGSSVRMSTRLGEGTLAEIIDDFLYDNSVDGGGLEQMKGGDTFAQYQGVYIPLTANIRGRERRQGAKDVAQKLVNHLNGFGITADYKVVGLGKVNMFIR